MIFYDKIRRLSLASNRPWILIALILFSLGQNHALAQTVNGQQKRIKLEVQDAHDKSALPYAVIVSLSSNTHYTTNDKGVAYLPKSLSNSFLSISYVGYQPVKRFRLSGAASQTVLLESDNNSRILASVEVRKSHAKNLTSNATLLSQETISQGFTKNLADLLRQLPGCRSLSSGAAIEKPIIEGMSGSRIAIINNGSRLVGQHWGDDHAPEISLPTYAKVEVVKGAESVKYGANAIGGVIVVNTDLNPHENKNHLEASVSASTNGRMFGGALAWEQRPFANYDFRYRLSYKYQKSGDYKTADYLLYNTGSRLHDAQADLVYQPYKTLTFNAHGSYYDATLGIYTGSHIGTIDDLLERFKEGRPPKDIETPFSYHIGVPKQHVIHGSGTIGSTIKIGSQDNLSLKLGYQMDYRREYEFRKGRHQNLPSFAFKLSTYEISTNWSHLFGSHDELKVGGSMLYSNNVSDTDTKAVPLIPNYIASDYGLYAIILKHLSTKSLMDVGIRLDHRRTNSAGYDSYGEYYGGKRNFTSVSGAIGFRHQFSQTFNLKTNVGLAWRPPEMNELYSNGVHHGEAVFQKGDPNLSTEKSLKWTINGKFDNKNFSLEANVFAQCIFDFIYDVPHYSIVNGKLELETFVHLNGIFPMYFYTQSNGFFAGGDLQLGFQITKGLRYTIRGEWMRARNLSTKGYFPNIPSDRYMQRLDYRTTLSPSWKLQCNVNHQIITKQRRFDPLIDLLPDSPAGYQLIGAEVSTTCDFEENGRLNLFLRGENLLNQLYKDYTNRLRFFAHDKGFNLTAGISYTL